MEKTIVIAKHAINGAFQSLRATGSPREGMVTTDAMEWICWRSREERLDVLGWWCCKRAELERKRLWPTVEWFPAEVGE